MEEMRVDYNQNRTTGNRSNISQVEAYIYALLTGTGTESDSGSPISSDVFIANMPEKLGHISDFALISCNSRMYDKNAFATGNVFIYLYARPIGEKGLKNVSALNAMEDALDAKLAHNQRHKSETNYELLRGVSYSGFDSRIKWHYNVVELIIKVF